MILKHRSSSHFFAHLVYQAVQSCCVHRRRWRRCTPLLATGLNRNFIFGTHTHLCPSHMHIKYLVILTCSFKMAAIWSSAGRSFVMRSLNPCPENFDQIAVLFGGRGGKLPNANCDQTTKWKISKHTNHK